MESAGRADILQVSYVAPSNATHAAADRAVIRAVSAVLQDVIPTTFDDGIGGAIENAVEEATKSLCHVGELND